MLKEIATCGLHNRRSKNLFKVQYLCLIAKGCPNQYVLLCSYFMTFYENDMLLFLLRYQGVSYPMWGGGREAEKGKRRWSRVWVSCPPGPAWVKCLLPHNGGQAGRGRIAH
jgi:hypothetical protein